MATPNAESTSGTNRPVIFAKKKRDNHCRILWERSKCMMSGKHMIKAGDTAAAAIQELFRHTLPAAAQHLDGKALDGLKQANTWLAVFEPGSLVGWDEAKSAFLENGPACLDVLASFTALTGFENTIGIMLAQNVTVSTRLLSAIRDRMEYVRENPSLDPEYSEQHEEVDKSSDADIAEGLPRSRVNALLRNRSKAIEVNELSTIQETVRFTYYGYRCLFELLWETHFCPSQSHKPATPSKSKYNGNETLQDIEILEDIVSDYVSDLVRNLRDMSKAHVLVEYKRNVQSFVRQVGCAKVHDEPEENIAELRLFHSTTIGYFAKLQDQYLKKVLEAKELRHHITALEFRFLLENLTPPHQAGTQWSDPNAGPRWMKFWDIALETEYKRFLAPTNAASAHALKSIVDARNPKRGHVHQKTGDPVISTVGQNGQLYRTGNDLYGTLSDEIHKFRGKEFKIEDDDGWTKVVTDTLRALKPLEVNIDTVTGEVDWAA